MNQEISPIHTKQTVTIDSIDELTEWKGEQPGIGVTQVIGFIGGGLGAIALAFLGKDVRFAVYEFADSFSPEMIENIGVYTQQAIKYGGGFVAEGLTYLGVVGSFASAIHNLIPSRELATIKTNYESIIKKDKGEQE